MCEDNAADPVNIGCYVRQQHSSRKIQDSSGIRIKKLEMKELCEGLEKTIGPLKRDTQGKIIPSVSEYMRIGLMFAADQTSPQLFCKLVAVFPDVTIDLCRIKPLSMPLIPLAKALMNPPARRTASDSGFLTLDQEARVVPLDSSDQNARTYPLIGVWVAGTQETPLQQSAAIMAAVMRFMFCQELGPRASPFVAEKDSEGRRFLLAKFGCKPGAPKFYELRIRAPASCWVMFVDTITKSLEGELVFQLTMKKPAGKQQSSCSLYKLSRAIGMIDGSAARHNINKENCRPLSGRHSAQDFRKPAAVPLAQQQPTSGCRVVSAKFARPASALERSHVPPNEPVYVPDCRRRAEPRSELTANICRNGSVPLAASLNSSRGPASAAVCMVNQMENQIRRTSMGGSAARAVRSGSVVTDKRAASVMHKIVQQQQVQIKMLEQQICQAVQVLRSMKRPDGSQLTTASLDPALLENLAKSVPMQAPLFDLNSRFKANIANCRQLNISNTFGQASPSFLRSGDSDSSCRNSQKLRDSDTVLVGSSDTSLSQKDTAQTAAELTVAELKDKPRDTTIPTEASPAPAVKAGYTKAAEITGKDTLSAIKETNESVTSPESGNSGKPSQSSKKKQGDNTHSGAAPVSDWTMTMPKIVYNEEI